MTLRFCKDCAHCVLESAFPAGDGGRLEFARCKLAAVTANPVTGIEHGTFCSTARLPGQLCGAEGTLFEAKTA
jgi:hypothetical protein